MDSEQSIMNKILSARSPLSEWGARVHHGIGVGYRKAFVVDDGSDEGKYTCAVFNSVLGQWFALQVSATSSLKFLGVEAMPIPKITAGEQRPFIALVDKILAAKAADPLADTSELEEKIDWLVYDLYDLTNEEVTAVADALWDGEVSEEEEDAALVRAIEAGLAEDDERFDISVAKEILSEFSEGRI